jgi:hypothetical protein
MSTTVPLRSFHTVLFSLGMLVPYNQHVVRDRTVAGHVAL